MRIQVFRNCMFLSARCYLLWAEGFSCSLHVLYGGLERRKLQFLMQKISLKNFQLDIFFLFGHQNPRGSGLIFRLKSWSGSRINESKSETLPPARGACRTYLLTFLSGARICEALVPLLWGVFNLSLWAGLLLQTNQPVNKVPSNHVMSS
jgi:hypothetical protein